MPNLSGVTFALWAAMVLGCSVKKQKAVEQNEALQTIPLCQSVAVLPGIEKLPPPQLRTEIGNSHLVINTKNPKAQQWFDQGLNLLHGFWHLEAYRAFNEVIKADSTAAMGYWGIAMCQPGFGAGNNRLWVNAIEKANALKTNSPPLHRALIEAGTVLIKQGIEAAQTPFRQLYKTFPDEPEAIAFASIILRQHQNEATQQEVKTLLQKAIVSFPNHTGLLHYYVHVMELRPEFAEAKALAAKMARLAANSPHLIHMPGHLYFLAGEYDKAAQVFEKARQQEYAYHKAENIPFSANQNYLHNLQFLAITQAERGDYQVALTIATQLANTTLNTTVPNEGAEMMLLYEGRILPALVHIRFHQWKKAEAVLSFWLNSLDVPLTNPLVRTYLEAMRAYARGMESLTQGGGQSTANAIQYGAQLSQLLQQFEQLGIQKQQSPEFKSINETYDILSMARYELAGWIDNIDPAKPFNDTAWKAALDLEKAIAYDEPPRLMYPIGESLGRLHQQRHENQLAKQAYHLALRKRPRSPLILKRIHFI